MGCAALQTTQKQAIEGGGGLTLFQPQHRKGVVWVGPHPLVLSMVTQPVEKVHSDNLLVSPSCHSHGHCREGPCQWIPVTERCLLSLTVASYHWLLPPVTDCWLLSRTVASCHRWLTLVSEWWLTPITGGKSLSLASTNPVTGEQCHSCFPAARSGHLTTLVSEKGHKLHKYLLKNIKNPHLRITNLA